MTIIKYLLSSSLLLLLTFPALAQNQDSEADRSEETVNVFLDCNRCNDSYIRQEITFINYVRDKEDSDVHLLITQQRTGSGGSEFTLRLLGRERFEGKNDTLRYVSPNSDTEDEERIGLVRIIKIGLLPYVSQTKALDNLSVTYREQEDLQTDRGEDKWNNWVFEIDGRSFFNGEESRSNIYLSGGVSADRVTPDWKINSNYDYDYNRQTFIRQDSAGNKFKDIFITRGQRFNGRVVKSLTSHWSAGVFTSTFSSTRNNYDLNSAIGPAIEYNIFPYSEYASHEISFMLAVPITYANYEEETIFNVYEEYLVQPSIRSRMDFTQPWGEIEGRLNGSAYLHDLTKNRLDLNLEFDFRVFRGLSLSLRGRYSIINDQLNIPKGDITDAQQLLNLRQQLTSYSYGGSVGIEFSFGSIYNNVVNPRF